MKTYRELHVWSASMDLTEMIYGLTSNFPSDELFSLTKQIRRAAVSIPSNIAEGWGRNHKDEYLHHLSIAYGSRMEVENATCISRTLEIRREGKSNERMDSMSANRQNVKQIDHHITYPSRQIQT